MSSWERVGRFHGKAVFFNTDKGLGIEEDHQHLREMNEEEEREFLSQELRFLGEYDYELSERGGTDGSTKK